MKFSLSNKYSLELHWLNSVWVPEVGYKLVGAYFSGPVLQIADEIAPVDKMVLDCYAQFYKFCDSPFLVEVSWKNVVYEGKQKVVLTDCFVSYNSKLHNKLPLTDEMWFLIDTQNHVIDEHAFSLTYLTYVLNSDGDLYDAT